MSGIVLSVRDLNVWAGRPDSAAPLVRDASFDLYRGEVLALLGESGSGKTKTAESILRLLPGPPAFTTSGRVILDGEDLMPLSRKRMRGVRGRRISMVFQEPMTALDPVFSVGHQLASVYRLHQGRDRRDAAASASRMLETVGIADADSVMQRYPHELSGGMRQRVMVGMAMACRPAVLIADEPTTALDVTTQAQVLSQMCELGREREVSILLITHDLGLVAQYCQRALVMQRGRIVETASVADLFSRPQHPYTRKLLASCPGAPSR